jgi:predicted nucleic acid-binding protein
LIVIDASLVVDFITAKISSTELSAALGDDNQSVFAPEILDIEVVNALRKLRLLDKATESECLSALKLFGAAPISRMKHAPLLDRIWELHTNMTAYDAAYIALAEQLNAELWTSDAKYSRTPGHTAKIKLFQSAP